MIDLKLPIKLSLYIGLPSLAFIIYFFQRNKKDSDSEFDYENAIRSRQSIVEVKVPSDCVRAIIGPGGAVIKEIQSKTGTRINLKEKNSENDHLLTEKTIVIRGSNINAQQAELEIKRLILDIPIVLTEEYYVPDYACGRIIGKGGANIREISQASNCRVKLNDKIFHSDNHKQISDLVTQGPTEDSFSKKTITISGSVEQISCAKKLIILKIKEEEVLREKRSNRQNNKFAKLNQTEMSSSKPCSNSSSFDKLSKQVEKVPSTQPPPPKLIPLNLEVYLDENKQANIYVSAICNPSAFWVQLNNEDSYKLEELLFEMNSFYNNENNESFNDLNELKIGSLVAAKYDKKNWHRAEIIGFKTIDNAQKIDVYFIDFGDSAYVDLNTLRRLLNKFYELPIQAIECKLDDIQPVDAYWTDETIDYFEEITYSCRWKTLKLTLNDNKANSSDKHKLPVNLFDVKKDKNITTLMIEKGFAKAKETDL